VTIERAALIEWCRAPWEELEQHPDRKIPLRIVRDSEEMGCAMATELFDLVVARARDGQTSSVIVPCGPMGWHAPFADLINAARQSLASLTVYHMDDCLDWQGAPMPTGHPYNFRSVMEREFYERIDEPLRVPVSRRHWLLPATMRAVADAIAQEPVDLALGGWGQDGHVAYNQARRDPYHNIELWELADSTVRIQENNPDTLIALAHRSFGGAYQFVPPMSVTLGMREILAAKRIRLFSDTGSWKQTALRIALFSQPDPEYPMTLLQSHPDVLLTATVDTADHPISHHPEWELL
jgi:glucosamine-6-phosphate deaminase